MRMTTNTTEKMLIITLLFKLIYAARKFISIYVCRRLSRGAHTSCIHSDWWRNTGYKRTPVRRFFSEHNHKSSTDSNCRNLRILAVSQSVNATFLKNQSASICSIDSVLRSCLMLLSWLVSSCTTSLTLHLTSLTSFTVLNLRTDTCIASFHNVLGCPL